MLHKLTVHRCMCYEHSFDRRSYSILVATTSESRLNSRSVVVVRCATVAALLTLLSSCGSGSATAEPETTAMMYKKAVARYSQTHDLAQAEHDFQAILQRDPKFAPVRYNLAAIATRKANFNQASKWIDEYAALAGPSGAERARKARITLEQAQKSAHFHHAVGLATRALSQGAFSKAEEQARIASQARPSAWQPKILLGVCAFEQGSVDAGTNTFRDGYVMAPNVNQQKLKPQLIEMARVTAISHLRKKEYDQAASYLKMVAEIDPSQEQFALAAACSMVMARNAVSARHLLDDLSKSSDSHVAERASELNQLLPKGTSKR